MSDSNIVAAPQKGGLVEYFKRPEVLEKFRGVLGNRANAYVQSVLIACTANKELMMCAPDSILRSALRAASLELSCDPSLKQAYLVPIKGRAEFWPHYLGLFNLAMRTGKYWMINVTPVREGQRVLQNNITGMHYLVIPEVGMVENDQVSKLLSKGYKDVTDGDYRKIIGYIGYFKTTRGFEKTVYMSVKEIAEHASAFSSNYNNQRSLWNDPKHRPTMEMKTVLRELLRWADLSGDVNDALRQGLDADIDQPNDEADFVDRIGEIEEPSIPQPDETQQEAPGETIIPEVNTEPDIEIPTGKMSLETAEAELNRDGIPYGSLPNEKLVVMYNALSKIDPVVRTEPQTFKFDAVSVILEARRSGTTQQKSALFDETPKS